MEIYQQINQFVNAKNNEKVIEITEQYLNSVDTTQNPTKETEDIFVFYINAKANKDNTEQIIQMFTKIYGKDKICSRDTTIMYINALFVCEKIDLATSFLLKHIIKISKLEDPEHKQTIEKLYEQLKSIKIDNSNLPQVIETVNKLIEDTLAIDDLSDEIKQHLNEIKEFKADEEDESDESENEEEIILTQSNDSTTQITYNIDVDTIDNEPLSNDEENKNEMKEENKQTVLEAVVDTVVSGVSTIASGVSSIAGKVKDTYNNMTTGERVGTGIGIGAVVVGLGAWGVMSLMKAMKKK